MPDPTDVSDAGITQIVFDRVNMSIMSMFFFEGGYNMIIHDITPLWFYVPFLDPLSHMIHPTSNGQTREAPRFQQLNGPRDRVDVFLGGFVIMWLKQ